MAVPGKRTDEAPVKGSKKAPKEPAKKKATKEKTGKKGRK